MKFELSRDDMVRVLRFPVQMTAKQENPILRNIRISVDGIDGIEVTGNNHLIKCFSSFNTTHGIDVVEDGVFICEGKRLLSLVSAFESDNIVFSIVRKKRSESEIDFLMIKQGRNKYEMSIGDVRDFPEKPVTFNYSKGKEFPSHLFNDIISRTLFASGKDNHDGIFLDFTKERCIGVSTDGSRIAFVEYDNPSELEIHGSQSGLRLMSESVKYIDLVIKNSEKFLGYFDDSKFHVSTEDNGFTCILSVKQYEIGRVNYFSLFEMYDLKSSIEFDSDELISALKNTTIIGGKDASCSLKFEKNHILVNSVGTKGGGNQEVEGISEFHKDTDISKSENHFTPSSIIDALKHIPVSEVKIMFSDDEKYPIVVMPVSSISERMMIMPLK